MKSPNLSRLIGATAVAALMFALSPVLSAQSASTYSASGLTKFHNGDDDGAIADFTKAIELNSSLLGAYLGRGMARSHEGNYDGAIADFAEVIKLKPTSIEAFYNKAITEFVQGNLGGASDDFDKLIELKPDSQAAYFYRGLIRDCNLSLQGGSEDFAKALAIKSGGDVASDYVVLYNAVFTLRMGGALDARAQAVTGWSNEWTKALASYLNEKTTAANLLKLAGTATGEVAVQQQTEAQFFIGMVQLQAGDKSAAKANFQKSFEASDPAAVVHRMARSAYDHL